MPSFHQVFPNGKCEPERTARNGRLSHAAPITLQHAPTEDKEKRGRRYLRVAVLGQDRPKNGIDTESVLLKCFGCT